MQFLKGSRDLDALRKDRPSGSGKTLILSQVLRIFEQFPINAVEIDLYGKYTKTSLREGGVLPNLLIYQNSSSISTTFYVLDQ